MWPSGSSPTMVNSRIWTSWRTCGKAFQTLTCMALDSLALHGQGAVGSVHMAGHVRFVMPCHAMMSHSCGTTQRLKFWNQCFLHLWKGSYCTWIFQSATLISGIGKSNPEGVEKALGTRILWFLDVAAAKKKHARDLENQVRGFCLQGGQTCLSHWGLNHKALKS